MNRDQIFNEILSSMQHKLENGDSLSHVGVLGMKWGRRKGPMTASQIAKQQKKAAKKQEKEEKKRQKILSSPTKLYKNRHKFTQAEIDTAMKRMKWERELRSLSRDELTTGLQTVQSILGYANTAKTIYEISKPIIQKIQKK